MEKEGRRILEIFAGLTFIVFLILLVFLVASVSAKEEQNTIINSYNTNSFNTNTQPKYLATKPHYTTTKPYIVSYQKPYTNRIYVKDYEQYNYKQDYDDRLIYYDWGEYKRVKGILGNDIDKYYVHVKNYDYMGGYFKVKYHFSDYYGKTSTETMTYYIGPQKEKRFVYQDISGDRYTRYNWRYEVIPETKTPTKTYYADGGHYVRVYNRGEPTRTVFYLN